MWVIESRAGGIQRFGVSAASVSRGPRLERDQGDTRPGPQGGDRRSHGVERPGSAWRRDHSRQPRHHAFQDQDRVEGAGRKQQHRQAPDGQRPLHRPLPPRRVRKLRPRRCTRCSLIGKCSSSRAIDAGTQCQSTRLAPRAASPYGWRRTSHHAIFDQWGVN